MNPAHYNVKKKVFLFISLNIYKRAYIYMHVSHYSANAFFV